MAEHPHVILSGTAYEHGVTHGKTFAEEIRRSVYLDRFVRHGVNERTGRATCGTPCEAADSTYRLGGVA